METGLALTASVVGRGRRVLVRMWKDWADDETTMSEAESYSGEEVGVGGPRESTVDTGC